MNSKDSGGGGVGKHPELLCNELEYSLGALIGGVAKSSDERTVIFGSIMKPSSLTTHGIERGDVAFGAS